MRIKRKIICQSATLLLCRQLGWSHKRIVVQVWTTSRDDNGLRFESLAKALLKKGVGRYSTLRRAGQADWRDTEQPEDAMNAAEAEAKAKKIGMFHESWSSAPTADEIEEFRANKRRKQKEDEKS